MEQTGLNYTKINCLELYKMPDKILYEEYNGIK